MVEVLQVVILVVQEAVVTNQTPSHYLHIDGEIFLDYSQIALASKNNEGHLTISLKNSSSSLTIQTNSETSSSIIRNIANWNEAFYGNK